MSVKPIIIVALTGLFLFISSARSLFAFPPPRPGLVSEDGARYATSGLPLVEKGGFVAGPGDKTLSTGSKVQAQSESSFSAQDINPPSQTVARPIVFLVDFSDRPQHRAASDFVNLFFSTASNAKSATNYWDEVSYGTFSYSGDATSIQGWDRPGVDFTSTITLNAQLTDSVFGLNVSNFETLLGDLVSSLDATVDFSQYDANGDGVVDAPTFVHAGWGAEDSGDPGNDIWSQTVVLPSPINVDGVQIRDVIIVPEEKFYNDPQFVATGTGVDDGDEDLIGVGVIVHETGHLMGLPDLYPTQTTGGVVSSNFSGVGVFDLMAYGMWGNTVLTNEDTPSHLSAWSKVFLGWVTPVVLSTSSSANIMSPVEAFPEVIKIFGNSTGDNTQYFLIENRQKAPDPAAPLPAWIFDNAMPGAGILIWNIDEAVINPGLLSNMVNTDPDFKGVDVEEADGTDELDAPIVGATPNDRAKFFGQDTDYFRAPAEVFDRTRPTPGVNETNSSPIISPDHPVDFGIDVTMSNFTVFPQSVTLKGSPFTVNFELFDLLITGGGGPPAVPDWKTFNIASTQPPGFTGDAPIVSDDITVIGQDSSGSVWIGTAASGISKISGRDMITIDQAFDGLPSDTITALAFESTTNVMWVGTDSGVARMRNRGNGFEVTNIYTTTAVPPFNGGLPSNIVNDLSIDGNGFLRVATANGLGMIDDGTTDTPGDDVVRSMLTGIDVRAVALNRGGNVEVNNNYDVIFAGDGNGNLYRADVQDPALDSDFSTISLQLNPIINDVASDSKGRIWIGTQNNGALVFDDKLNSDPADDDFDPLDINQNSDTSETIYIASTTPATQDVTSDRVTGISFLDIQGNTEPIVYLSHERDASTPSNDGGVTEIDVNELPADRFVLGKGLKVFREDPLVLPEDETQGPPSNTVRNAFTDSSGNRWFATDLGAGRFGNAGIISLDKSAYVNVSAIATVTLEDEGLNLDPLNAEQAVVFIRSSSDSTGIVIIVDEVGNDSGIFTGQFGFTEGGSGVNASGLKIIHVSNGDNVTASYFDVNPPGERTATATWSRVVPFSDTLLIEGCFIATATFGSYSAPAVMVFREFRDRYLASFRPGRFLIEAYYRYSPPLALFITKHRWAKVLSRSFLAPASALTLLVMGTGWLEKCLFLMAITALICFSAYSRNRCGSSIGMTESMRRGR